MSKLQLDTRNSAVPSLRPTILSTSDESSRSEHDWRWLRRWWRCSSVVAFVAQMARWRRSLPDCSAEALIGIAMLPFARGSRLDSGPPPTENLYNGGTIVVNINKRLRDALEGERWRMIPRQTPPCHLIGDDSKTQIN